MIFILRFILIKYIDESKNVIYQKTRNKVNGCLSGIHKQSPFYPVVIHVPRILQVEIFYEF